MRKTVKRIALLFSCFLWFQAICHAWMPSAWFFCEVVPENLPEGTVYIDLLLPLKAGDDHA